MSVKRITVSIPADLADQLTELSQFLGISRSSLLTGILQPAVGPMMALLSATQVGAGDAVDGRQLQRAAYDRLAQLEVLLREVHDDVARLQ